MADYDLEPHHLRLLQAACESWDRILAARVAIATDGAYFRDKFEQIKPHPALSEERQNRILFARLVRELALDVEPPNPIPGQPPTIVPNAGRRAG